MECNNCAACGAVIIATLAFLILSNYFSRRRNLKLPPGPKPWPVIGNLHLIGPLPHRSIQQLSQKHGPLMQLWFGSRPVIVASSPEIAKLILKTHDVTFASRPKTAAGKYTTYNYTDINWSPYGPYWKQARKLCVTELFSAKRLGSFEYIRVEEMKMLLKTLYQSSGQPVMIKYHLLTLTSNVMCRMVMGKSYLSGKEGLFVTPKEFEWMLAELFVLNGVINLGDFIPWISFLDLQGYVKRMKILGKKFDRFWEYVLQEHDNKRKAVKDYVAKDLVDVLLEMADKPNLQIKLERDNVKAFTQDLLAGGAESAASILEWGLSELLKKPGIFQKAAEELDRVIGKERWVDEKDIPNLPYIDAICKEVMRLHPVAPLLSPHMARENCKIDGYDILKGSIVFVSTWTIGRDPKVWDDPNEFCPERFLGKVIDVEGQNFELLPFGSGRRRCPGYSLGLKLVQLNLANLLHGFTWKLPRNMMPEDLDMEEKYGLSTPRKIPLAVTIEPRLPPHLYSIALIVENSVQFPLS